MGAESWYARLPVFAQDLACTWGGFQRYRARYTPHFRETLTHWEALGAGSDEELRGYQYTRLARLLQRVQKAVPHYAGLSLPPAPPLAKGADPAEALATTLAALPTLDKSTLREAPERLLSADMPRDSLLRGKTSGTTGSAIPLWYTREALAEEYAVVWRLRRTLGVGLDDPHFTFGGQLVVPFDVARPPFWRRNAWSKQTLFSLYHMSEAFLPFYVEAMHSLPCEYVVGYPSSLHRLARALLDAGRPIAPGRIKGVFPSSESLLAFQREAIGAAFGAPVRDRYGTSEFAVSMTECAEGFLHVDMEFGIVEVDVEERGPGWERGPLLVTGLANAAMPLIRYRIGDVGTRLSRPCPCGRSGDVFQDVDGRLEDYVVTPDGRWIGRLDHIFKDQRSVAEAQILQESSEEIVLKLVPVGSFGGAEERLLMKEIRSRLGDEIGVRIDLVDEIPREANGKFRAVKSKVARLNG